MSVTHCVLRYAWVGPMVYSWWMGDAQAGSLRPSVSLSLPEIGLAAHLAGCFQRFTPKQQMTHTKPSWPPSLTLLEMDLYG